MSQASATENSWDDILDPGETIEWQGSPTGKIRSEFNSVFEFVFMVIWGGIPTAIIIGNPAAALLVVPTLFMGVALWYFIGQHIWGAYKRSNTFYTLTDQRLFIATSIFGNRKLNNIPISQDLELELDDQPGGNVWINDKKTTGTYVNGKRKKRGLEQLADPRKAYAMLRDVQRRSTRH